ncbi:MAG: DUF481 domain-containing protein [Kiritimatiellae bacterium]|nr:DUF481 domain-containing protein [Kiritimatiellia bacterium]
MQTKLLTATVVATLAATVALADKVTLVSGSYLTGTAGDFDGNTLKFTSDDLGEVAIDVSKIAALESDRTHVVRYRDLTTATLPVTVVNGAYQVGETTLDMANVKDIDPAPEGWHGSVNFSGMVTRGNTVGESASLTADVNRRWEKDRLTADAGYYYAASGDSKQDKQKTTSRFEAQAQEDHFWSQKFYTYVNGKYETDRIMDLEYRWRVGLGGGYQWLENDDFGFGKVSFNQEVGMSYVGEKFEHVDDDNYGAFRYAHHLAWEIAAVKNLSFAHNLEWLPQVDEWADNYIIDADAGIVYKFSANWQLVAKVEWDYKSKVAPGTKHSDLRYILGLGYTW